MRSPNRLLSSYAVLSAACSCLPACAKTITALSAATLPQAGHLVIRGSGFCAQQGAGTVTIGGFLAPVAEWSDSKITAYVPDTAPIGSDEVAVNANGGSSNTLPLTVTARQSSGRVLWAVPGRWALHSRPPGDRTRRHCVCARRGRTSLCSHSQWRTEMDLQRGGRGFRIRRCRRRRYGLFCRRKVSVCDYFRGRRRTRATGVGAGGRTSLTGQSRDVGARRSAPRLRLTTLRARRAIEIGDPHSGDSRSRNNPTGNRLREW
jgi:hypothetical protein